VRVGKIANALSDQDIADLERVAAPDGARPWLILGPDTMNENFVQSVQAYFAPETATPDLRRGQLVWVERRLLTFSIISTAPIPLSPTGQPIWVLKSRGTYAQVAVPGRDFAKIDGDGDINRPFSVSGPIDDDELIRLVRFVRSKPAGPAVKDNRYVDPTVVSLVHGDWPILSVSGDTSMVTVRLRADDASWQEVTLFQSGVKWMVVSIRLVFT
jgi:hypothetical protein